jgi:ketosteroid isomerase-like protein
MMLRALFVVLSLLLIAACATSLPELTSTPVPPTKPPPPTDTSVPPTKAPNPHAESVLLAYAEAINDQDLETAQELFSNDATFTTTELTYRGKEEITEELRLEIEMYKSFYKFSEFEIEGDKVAWTWFINDTIGKHLCEGKATMDGNKITSIKLANCD